MANFGFIPVSLSTLYPTDGLGLDLYIRPQGFQRPVLYCAGKRPLEPGDLGRLEESGVTKLYIRREAREQYQQFLRDHLDIWLENDRLPLATRISALNEVVRDVLGDLFGSGPVGELVAQTRQFGEHAARLLAAEPFHFRDLARILHHDFAAFTHAANVGYYAVLLAAAAGLNEANRIEIAAGGFLHDLGKLDIDDRILTKDGRLADSQSRQVRLHPTTGFRRLCRCGDLSPRQLLIVYQHHERLDGTGYPVGIRGDEIHPWAKICTVVDAFEALTSLRPYRKPLSVESALQVMNREIGITFDSELLRCWTTLVLSPTSR